MPGLLFVAIGIGYKALSTLRVQHLSQPGWIALLGPFLTIFVKEILYRRTMKIGVHAKSTAVIANAWHHRSDALSSIPVALAVIVGYFFPQLTSIDHVAALVVCVLLFKATWDIGWPSVRELMEENDGQQFEDTLQKLVGECEAIQGIHRVRTKRLGSMHAVDFHMMVDPQTRVVDAHDLAHQLERDFVDLHPEVIDVLIHIEPVHDPSGE